MSITESCRKITISKGVLSAECRKSDHKTYVSSSISLDDYLGVVDGKFAWGGKGFSHAAQDVVVVDGILSAKLKTVGGKFVDSKFDLHHQIHNNNGVLEVVQRPRSVMTSPRKTDTVKTAPGLLRATSLASSASAATESSSATNLSSATSSSSTATSISSSASTVSKGSFSSTDFKSQSKHLPIEDTCTKFELEGCHLKVECRRLDGSIACSSIDLNECIGIIDGQLGWDRKGFRDTCSDIALDEYHLTAKCRHGGEDRYCRLDLRTRIRNADGILICIELEKKLSVMLSEVPWMKFKVVAETDLSVFAKHPVIEETLIRIAETTVEHVTLEMHKKLTIAMQEAISIVTVSAIRHVSEQMEILVKDAVGCVTARASVTEAECLHLFGNEHGRRHRHGHEHHECDSNCHERGHGNGYGNGYGRGSYGHGQGPDYGGPQGGVRLEGPDYGSYGGPQGGVHVEGPDYGGYSGPQGGVRVEGTGNEGYNSYSN